MEWGLFLTICVAMSSGDESCKENLKGVFPDLRACMVELDHRRGQPSDRYYSCGMVAREDGDRIIHAPKGDRA